MSHARAVRRGGLELIREEWRDGRLELADRLSGIARIDYVAQWRLELRAGVAGQSPASPGTWKLDGLWRAACIQLRAEATQRLLSDAAEFRAVPSFLAGIVDDIERDWESAHRAYRSERAVDLGPMQDREIAPRLEHVPACRRRSAGGRRRAWEINLERALQIVP